MHLLLNNLLHSTFKLFGYKNTPPAPLNRGELEEITPLNRVELEGSKNTPPAPLNRGELEEITPLDRGELEGSKTFLTFFLTILFLNSCTNLSDQANERFLKQFKTEVQNINRKREIANQSLIKDSDSANPSNITNQDPPQNMTNQLPQDMFIISYNLYNFPESYGITKLSFDDIIIPDNDIFGVKTNLGEKNYQLIDNQTLQKNIDLVNQLNGDEDKKISLELIRQEKKIRRNHIKTK